MSQDNWISRYRKWGKSKDKRISAFDAFIRRRRRRFFNKLSGNKILWKRFRMLIYAIPNLIITAIVILAFGFQLGWDKLIQFPYELIWLYLIWFGGITILLKLNEPIEEEKERKELIEDITKKVSESNDISFKPLNDSIQQLILEIQKDRKTKNGQ